MKIENQGGNIIRYGLFRRLVEDLKDLFNLLRDYSSGRYRKRPYRVFISVGIAVLYLVIPFDLIPDYLLGIGQVDDALVIAICLFLMEGDLRRYKDWKRNQ